MSKEQAQAFLEKVKNDEDLQKRLNEAQDKESRLEIAKQEGFEFTLEEIKEAKSELGEDEMDKVAGGHPCEEVCHPPGCKEELRPINAIW